MRQLYTEKLDSLRESDFADPGRDQQFKGEFEYALVDLTGFEFPEMLVRAEAKEFSSVRVFAPAEDASSLREPEKIFLTGAADVGGSRADLAISAQEGLLEKTWMSGTGATTTKLWQLDGQEMKESGQLWEYRLDQVPADLAAKTQEIQWHDVTDRGPVDSLRPEAKAASPAAPEPAPNAADNPGQIGGVCGSLDGASVEAGQNTSCGFAMNVAEQAMVPGYRSGVHPNGDESVTPFAGVKTINATSPATGTSYTMECTIGSAADIVLCRGGNDAQVMISKSRNGAMLYLVTD